MSKFRELIKSPRIQVELATGFSIIVMASVSRWVLPEPIGYLPLAIPPFLMVIYEAVVARHKNSRVCTAWYWISAILIATLIVIASHLF